MCVFYSLVRACAEGSLGSVKPWPRAIEGDVRGSSDVFTPSQDRASVPQLPVRASENGSKHVVVPVKVCMRHLLISPSWPCCGGSALCMAFA